jgi:hypothetical protein
MLFQNVSSLLDLLSDLQMLETLVLLPENQYEFQD